VTSSITLLWLSRLTNTPISAHPTTVPPTCYPSEQVSAHVKDNVRQRIWNGEFVDFSSLLPSDTHSHPQGSSFKLITDDDGRPLFKPVERLSNKPLTLNSWTSAFHIFMSLYLLKHPSKAQELLTYAQTVRGAAGTFGGESWSVYDYHFRHKMARDPTRSWGVIDGDIWLKYLRPAMPASTPGRSYTQFSAAATPSPTPRETGYCWDFNSSRCKRDHCRFPHICSICRSTAHSALTCFPGKGGTSAPRQRSSTSGKH